MTIPRIKVVFDRNIHERNEDAKPTLVLVDHIQYPRVSDFCERLISLFDLSQVCPHGITLSINGQLLMPWDTTHVLRDNDIVRVAMTKGEVIVPEVINEHNQNEVKPVSSEV